jgi:hypothetical protein
MFAQTQVFPCSAVGADGEKITVIAAATSVAAITGLARFSRQDTGDMLDELENGVYLQISTGKIFRCSGGDDVIPAGYL